MAVLFVLPLIAAFLIGPSPLAASDLDRASASAFLRATLHKPSDRPLSIAFYVNWDNGSYAALKTVLPHLDWVIPGWLTLDGADLRTDMEARVASPPIPLPKTPMQR